MDDFLKGYQSAGKKWQASSSKYWKEKEKEEATNQWANEQFQQNYGTPNPDGSVTASSAATNASVVEKAEAQKQSKWAKELIGKVDRGIKENKSRKDIARDAGVSERELNQYLEENDKKDYKKPGFWEGLGGLASDIGEGIADATTNKVIEAFKLHDDDYRNELNARAADLEKQYKAGEISYEKFKTDTDDMMRNSTLYSGRRSKATEEGFQEIGAWENTLQQFGASVEGGATFAGGPAGAFRQMMLQTGKQTIGSTLKTAAKYGALEGAFTGTADLAGQSIAATGENQFEGALSLENILVTYGANALLGGGGEALGVGVKALTPASKDVGKALDKRLVQMSDNNIQDTELMQQVSDIAREAKDSKDFNTQVDTLLKDYKPVAKPAAEAGKEVAEDVATEPAAPNVNEKLARQSKEMIERLDSIDTQISLIQEGMDPSVRRVIGRDGVDVSEQVTQLEGELRLVNSKIRDLEMQAEGIDLNSGTTVPKEGIDPSTYDGDVQSRTKAAESIDALRAKADELSASLEQEFELHGGVETVIDTNLAKSKFKDLNQQRREADNWLMQNSALIDANDIEIELRDIQNGEIPTQFIEKIPEVQSLTDLEARLSDLPSQNLRTQFESDIQDARLYHQLVDEQIENLWTQDKHNKLLDDMDGWYNERVASLEGMAEPRANGEKMLIDAEYEQRIQESEARLLDDQLKLQDAEMARQLVNETEADIMSQWNSIEQTHPVEFGRVDTEALTNYVDDLQAARLKKAADVEPADMTPTESSEIVQNSVKDADNPTEVIDSDKTLSTESQMVASDALRTGKEVKNSLADQFFRLPRSVIARMPNGKGMLEQLDKANKETAIDNGTFRMRSINNEWRKAYSRKAPREQTVKFLDEGVELKKMPNESDAAFAKRQGAVNDIKSYFEEMAERLGLPKEERISNYYPHFFEQHYGKNVDKVAEAIERLNKNINKNGKELTDKQRAQYVKDIEGVDIDTRRLIEKNRLYDVGENGHLIKRQGAEGWSDDVAMVLSEYQRMAMRQIHMEPALKRANELSGQLNDNEAAYMEKFVKQWKGEPNDLDKVLQNTGGKNINARSVMQTWRRLSNAALMGMSARTIAVQVGGVVNNAADSTVAEFWHAGYKALLSNTIKRKGDIGSLRMEAMGAGAFDNSFSGYLTGGKGISSKMSRGEESLYAGISFIDETMRLQAYEIGKMQYAKSIGKKLNELTPDELEAAKKSGVAKANKTQFSTSGLDIPVGHENEFAKMVLQIQQFNIKQTEYNFRLLFGKDADSLIYKDGNKVKFSKHGAERLAKYMMGFGALTYAMTGMYGDITGDESGNNLFGFGWEDFIPFGEQVHSLATGSEMQAVVPPIYSFIAGRGGQDKGLIGAITAVNEFQQSDKTEDDQKALAAEFEKLPKNIVRNLLPTGTQLVRTLEGAQALRQGESKNTAGSTRFLVDNTNMWNQVKGLIAGQYATDEGQKWLAEGMNTISKKNTVKTPDGNIPASEFIRENVRDPEEKAIWVNYYQTKQNVQEQLKKSNISTNEVKKRLRLGLAAGQYSQRMVEEESQKHNSMVLQLFKPVFESGRIPPPLQVDMMQDFLINGSTINPARQTKDKTDYSYLNGY